MLRPSAFILHRERVAVNRLSTKGTSVCDPGHCFSHTTARNPKGVIAAPATSPCALIPRALLSVHPAIAGSLSTDPRLHRTATYPEFDIRPSPTTTPESLRS